VCDVVATIPDTSAVIPKIHINKHNNTLELLEQHLNVWKQAIDDYTVNYSRNYILSVERERETHIEGLINRYRSQPEKLARLISEWAARVAQFPHTLTLTPPHLVTHFGPMITIKNLWCKMIRDAICQRTLICYDEHDITELIDEIDSSVPCYTPIGTVLIQALRVACKTQYEILEPDYITEQAQVSNVSPTFIANRAIQATAFEALISGVDTTAKPDPKNYLNKIDYIKALALYNSAKHRT
jgi:hypothetical protein